MTRVLLLASNGVGLGHTTRTAAIARQLPAQGVQPVVVALSPLVGPLRRLDLVVEHIQSYAVTGLPRWRWQRMLAAQLEHLIDVWDARAVVFDGVSVYPGVRAAMSKSASPPFVWVRRGLWQSGVHDRQELRRAAEGFAAVITPGEQAEQTVEDGVIGVGPVLLVDDTDPQAAAAGRAELAVAPDARLALVSLGVAAGGGLAETERAVCAALLSRGLTPLVARSPLAGVDAPTVPPGSHELRRYPLAPLLPAMEIAVVAAGYNSVAEVRAFGVPALLIPSPAARTDDQRRRARDVEAAGGGVVWAPAGEGSLTVPDDRSLLVALDRVLALAAQGSVTRRDPPQGAAQAAAVIAGIVRADHPVAKAEAPRPPARSRVVLSGRGYRLARAAYRGVLTRGPSTVTEPLRHVVQRNRSRLRPDEKVDAGGGIAVPGPTEHDVVLVVALGLDGGAIRGLRDVIERAPVRAVWLSDTDAVDAFDGAVLERIPPADDLTGAGQDPHAMLARRLGRCARATAHGRWWSSPEPSVFPTLSSPRCSASRADEIGTAWTRR